MMLDADLVVTIKKDELVEILRLNRETHRAVFDEAVQRYHEQALVQLNEHIQRITKARKGPIVVRVVLPIPEDHTTDYDRVIGMLDKHTGETVTLTESKYRNFVEDEWDWTRAWAGSTASYVAE